MEFVMLDEDNMKELEKNEKSSIVLFKKNSLNPSLSFKMFLMQLMIKHRWVTCLIHHSLICIIYLYDVCLYSIFLRRDVFEDILSNYLAKSLCDLDNNQAKKELYMIIIQSIEVW